jgi:hypothetical protein
MSSELSSERVEDLFRRCLADTADQGVAVTGIVTTAAFDPQVIGSHREEIGQLLSELPRQFQESGGGGWSFLNACMDRNGRQWTSYHRTMEQLFLLGLASGQVRELLPRDLWPALPGGMPYYAVRKSEEPDGAVD